MWKSGELLPGRVRFGLLDQLPGSLRGVILDWAWNLSLLHCLSLPVGRMAVGELEWHLELPYWRAPGGSVFSVTPREVVTSPCRYRDQFQRTLAADLSFPIHVLERDGRWVILDGVHRLLKAYMDGAEMIDAIRVPASALSDFAVTE